ncbi:MAG: NADP-dependent oxidoreductase [Nocardioidaceae bacterium]
MPMRVVGVDEFGGPDALRVFELAEGHAGPGEVRLRVHAAAVNPTDTIIRSGGRAEGERADPPPQVPGMDAAGVLDEIGDGATTDLEVGDHVMAIVVPQGSHGAYGEYVVVPGDSVARTPAGADDVAAATLPMNGLTARLALDTLDLPPGASLAVTGAAGAFGGYVVQLAKADGLTVIADAAPQDEDLVRGLGADVVVGRGEGVADRIRAVEPDGVDAVADGALQGGPVAAAVRDGGRFVSVRGYEGDDASRTRGVSFHPIMVRGYARERARLDRLREQVEDGTVTLRVARTFPAEQASQAHRTLEAGGTRGRLVLEF